MKKNIFIFLFVIILICVFPLSKIQAGGGGGKSGKNNDPPANVECDNITYSEVKCTLWDWFDLPPGRLPEYDPAPMIPNPWSGAYGATSPYDDANYFCVITLTSPDCSKYSETIVWDVNGTIKNIDIPNNIAVRVTVEYHEQCGPYYTNFTYFRAFWSWEQLYYDTPVQIDVDHFIFDIKIGCN